ncbi:MAG: WXG100 family type VII secretion target [Clostridiales bacterium]|jgi:WXG100 family type VII secretion target|nr:WXG100 family type VII secretion target [Clostridiales bacterium]
MATIKITPETLETQARQLDGFKQQHEQVYSQIKQLVTNLSTEWEGEANRAFTESFNQRDAEFKKFSADIDSFRTRMETAAREMRQAEESVKAKMAQM